MNIIYILTIVLILILQILLYKKEERQNFLKSFATNILIFLTYNIFISVILSFLGIPTTLVILSIVNIIISIVIGYKIYKDKKIQKYYIQKIDIIATILMLIIVLVTAIKQYGIPLNLKNAITDAGVHYFAADEFFKTSKLLFNGNSDILNLFNLQFLQPGAYINTGILFKIFSGIISETYFCKIYFIFDISMWYLSGILMYVLLTQNKKENKKKILPLIFSLVYMLGYPLNSLISGFSYLSIGLNIIIGILIIIREDINKYYKLIILFLLNFGIMFTYYFFAPVVYLAELWQIIKDNKKVFKIENIVNIFFTLVIPGIFGILYFIIFQTIKYNVNPLENYSEVFAIKGDIYANLITNILPFIVLAIYFIICNIKNNKIENKMLILSIIFTIALYVGMRFEKVSKYYYYKSYYMLWILVIFVALNAVEKILQKNKLTKIITLICVILYCIGIICSIKYVQKFFIFDIYRENANQIKNGVVVVTDKEIEVLDYYNKNINTNKDETFMCYSPTEAGENKGKAIWIYGITKNPYNFIDVWYGEISTDLQQYINDSRKYAVILKNDYYGDFEQIDKYAEENNLQILFQNEAGIILEKI